MAITLEDEAAEAMRRVLRGYAERHVVKDLDEAGEAVDFALPGAGRLRLVCDPAKRSLTLRGLLPDVPANINGCPTAIGRKLFSVRCNRPSSNRVSSTTSMAVVV